MSKNNLFIDIFRISPDGKYLEIDMTCHSNYTYESFKIYEYTYNVSSGGFIKDFFNELNTDPVTGEITDRQLLRFSVDTALNGKSMYYAEISIKYKGTITDPITGGPYVPTPQEITDSIEFHIIATSDISNVYFYLLPGLVHLTHPCDPCDFEIPTEIQRAFLIMWAHIEAMRLERFQEAEMFYTMIKNNFQNCLSEYEVKYKSCNCHAKK